MDGNYGLKLECQSVTIVSALQGTRTSSKLFKVEHRVPPRVRKIKEQSHMPEQEQDIPWAVSDLQLLNIP